MIPYGRQSIEEADLAAVAEVLRSPLLTQGPLVPQFEQALAQRTGAREAVCMNSATSALHAGCLALGLGAGDLYWTVPNTFVATANVARLCGAEVDFVDIDEASYLMDLGALEAKLADAARRGRAPKIVAPVHFAGRSLDMARLAALRDRYGFRILEDASHALGAEEGGRLVGACRYSDIAVFSFHPVKILTTAEGGAALTNDAELARTLRLLRSHGIVKDLAAQAAPEGPWSYEQVMLGFNYRMSELHAALGLSQIERLDGFLARRRAIAARYHAALARTVGVSPPPPDGETLSSWHLYVVRLKADLDRLQVFQAMRDQGIGVQVLYIPVHTQPYWRGHGFRRGDFPASERFYARSFTLPIFPDLTSVEQERILEALSDAVTLAGRAG